MRDFEFYNPTHIVFGENTIGQLADLIPAGAKVLLTYGGGSIHRNGVYAQVMAALDGVEVVEFGGIEPNPLHETCIKAMAMCRKQNITFLLAAGGGSVLDATKYIAAGACYDGDPWDLLLSRGAGIERALPVGTVLTLPATGSEANGTAVISRAATDEKLALMSDKTFPVFSILDPTTTFSLPAHQVRNGLVDTFVHVTEQYIHDYTDAPLPDRFAEGILQTLIEIAPITLDEPKNYSARASFMWCATMALNRLIGCGTGGDFATHRIGHELTAFYGLAHAETLAVMLPAVWGMQIELKRAKLEQMGKRVFGVGSAEKAIHAAEMFFHSLGMPTRLGDYNVDADEAAQRIQTRFAQRGNKLGEREQITPELAGEMIRSRR